MGWYKLDAVARSCQSVEVKTFMHVHDMRLANTITCVRRFTCNLLEV